MALNRRQRDLLAEAHHTTLGFVDGASREIYQRVYEEQLYVRRGIIAPTPRANLADSYQRHTCYEGPVKNGGQGCRTTGQYGRGHERKNDASQVDHSDIVAYFVDGPQQILLSYE